MKTKRRNYGTVMWEIVEASSRCESATCEEMINSEERSRFGKIGNLREREGSSGGCG